MVYVGASETGAYATYPLNDTSWHHEVFVFDGTLVGNNRVKLYIDGTPVGLTYSGTPDATTTAIDHSFTIGEVAAYMSNGAVDDGRIYNRALSAAEILALYNAANPTHTVTVFLTSGTSWTVPSDWNSSNNTIEAIGGGGGGYSYGGGGGYSKITNQTYTAGHVITYQVGAGGAANTNGTDSFLREDTNTSNAILAKAGAGGTTGAGGAAASGVGTTKSSGGAGGLSSSRGGGGGGGAAGKNGDGKAGGIGAGGGAGVLSGGGGGGADAGSSTVGSDGPGGTTGGNGGTAQDGTAGGAGGNSSNGSPGSHGSGGGGDGGGGGLGGAGGNGIEWDSTHGSGGGGGGDDGTGQAGAGGGNYGGGGGSGATAGAGAQGIIVITYLGSGTGCSNPAGVEGTEMYNTTFNVVQFCNGSSWVKEVGTCNLAPASSGYFVLTSTTYNGNLGGLTGADAKCLTELTTNTNWRGYSTANSNGQLIAAKVHAFLCDSSSCNNLTASKAYSFANAGNSAAGGAYFTTDATGAGPGDAQSWGASNYFSGTYTFWSGRADNFGGNTATLWYTGTENEDNCLGWSNGTNVQYGIRGISANTDWNRWGVEGSLTRVPCDTSYPLVCFVNP